MSERAWATTIGRFEGSGGELAREGDGTWSISCYFAMASIGALLADTSISLVALEDGRVPMFDHTGHDVDDEATFGLSYGAAHRAVVTWYDHAQAGLSATLTVHATTEGFELGLREARDWFAEVSGNPTREDLEAEADAFLAALAQADE